MATTLGANTECSRCVTRLSSHRPPSQISEPNFNCSSKRFLAIPKLTSKEASVRATVSMSTKSSNRGETGGLTYKEAGVDIDAGSELVRRIAKMAPGIGGFGGLFPLGDSYLVAGTDGVGTKLKLAFETGIHETIGIDLVAMSVNDIVTSGAKPLFFLDYFATSHLDVDLAEKVIKGIVDGCQQSDCTLLGGETAEMPDFYAKGEYDLSGFAVGIVKKDSVIDGKNINVGDVLIGLPSSGVHSNGFSLVRRVLARSGLSLKNQLPGGSVTLGEALMAPTVIYVKQVLDIISKGGVKGIAHITGGGFTDNIPRVFPEGLGAVVYKDSWVVPPVFKWIQEAGRIEDAEMRRTFNMGIGMVLVVSQEAALRILGDAQGAYTAYRIGEIVPALVFHFLDPILVLSNQTSSHFVLLIRGAICHSRGLSFMFKALGLSCMTVKSDNKEAILRSVSELVLPWEVFAQVLVIRELVLSSALKFNWIRRTENKLAHPVTAFRS